MKRDGILWVFGKGVKFSGFWQRGKILGVSGKGGGGQFSVLSFADEVFWIFFCKMGKFSIVLQKGEILDIFAKGRDSRYFCERGDYRYIF